MLAHDIIRKKRDGLALTDRQIAFFVSEFVKGRLPESQMAAFLMAVYFKGMSPPECLALTLAMAGSGETADLSSIPGFTVDKHSTGGVGDKTTLVLAPLVAACGVFVPKMTGGELGHTGGTVDKLASIPGLRVELTQRQFVETARRVGFSLLAQTDRLAPADKSIYALRNATATVESIPLIAASIMSKKLAAGADGIVLDVKTGPGAFTRTLDQSLELARTMVDIGVAAGKKMAAVVTGMSQPLGMAIGNALEVREAIDALDGRGPEDLMALVMELGGRMLCMAGAAGSTGEARRILERNLAEKKGLDRLRRFIRAQGGNPGVVDDPDRICRAAVKVALESPAAGYVHRIDALEAGLASKILGAGRRHRDDILDPSIGIVLRKKVGDRVARGEPLAVLHSDGDGEKLRPAAARLAGAFSVGDGPVERPRLFFARIDPAGEKILDARDDGRDPLT